MSQQIETVDRNHEFGKKSDPREQDLAHEVSHSLIAYLEYMRGQPGYADLTDIQANLTRWKDAKHVPGSSYTFSIVHKTP
jgi:hypothetical protein